VVGLFSTSGQIAPTITGELSDPSNREAAFGYLVIFGRLGVVVGRLLGGLLTSPPHDLEESDLLATFLYLLILIVLTLGFLYRIWLCVPSLRSNALSYYCF
jgi:MFS-type transporter involved in bile tolerance (Atg22 family)